MNRKIAFAALLLTNAPVFLSAYSVLELHEEGIIPLFSISSVEDDAGSLKVFISTSNPAGVAEAIATGLLEAQLSTHSPDGSGTAEAVSFTFMKTIQCQAGWMTLPYSTPDPEGCIVADTRFFFLVPIDPLRPGQDLAFGLDPDSLWLIEPETSN
jgi:hypothetical protein